MVKAGYLWQSLHRRTFTSVEVNGNKTVKRLLGFSCLKGDTLAVVLPAASSSHCAHPRCSHRTDAELTSSVLDKLRCSSGHSLGLGLGQVCRQGSGNFRRASLETAASSQLLLHPAGPGLCPCLLREGKAVRGIPQPRFVGLHCI